MCLPFVLYAQNIIILLKAALNDNHDNRLKCSGLTNTEFEEHKNDEYKPIECDHCVSVKIAKENNSIFVRLPFPVECAGNIFGKPVEKARPDISSISPDQVKKFVKQCDIIRNQLHDAQEENDEIVSTLVNSNYYDINKFNKIKHYNLITFN